MDSFEIVREIGIDAAHRVPQHGSKCRKLHGHRYKIEAVCNGPLAPAGEQADMVLDFGFLKEEMMSVIDSACDHATILCVDDPLSRLFYPDADMASVESLVKSMGFFSIEASVLNEGVGTVPFKLYFIAQAPTAEVLARHWFDRLSPRVIQRSNGLAKLVQLIVWETPNCRASYPSR